MPTNDDLRPGDIVLARVRFNSDDGSGRSSKQRPVLVMEALGDECRVRPIHGSNSFVRRNGIGRRIRDWKSAGLRKPSVVAAADRWISANSSSRPIGRLAEPDRRRLLADATADI